MSKQWYKLVFKQIQPIHIGMGNYGVVNETRIFIPGWTMWGALTKAYNLQNNKPLSENQDLFENISCFYPCFNKNGENVLFPEFKEGEFYLGDYSEDEFRAKFVDTFISTAINPNTNTALDESLHELNIILPSAKADYLEKEEEKQLYWVGIIGLENDNIDIPNEIYIGGDIRYGLGKLILINKNNLFDNELNIWTQKSGYIPATEENLTNSQNKAKKLELLVELTNSWEKSELNVRLQGKNGFYFVPGSEVSNIKNDLSKLIKGVFEEI